MNTSMTRWRCYIGYLPSLSICMYLLLIDIFYTEIGKQDMRLIIIPSSGNKKGTGTGTKKITENIRKQLLFFLIKK